jgi:nucleolar protein 56
MAAVDYLLQETSVGYGLYQVVQQADAIGNRLKEVQEAAQDLGRFGKMIKLVSFAPFQSVASFALFLVIHLLTRWGCRGAAQALENANDISEGIVNDHLKALLELGLPKGGKKKKVVLGISDKNLAASIKASFPGVDCETNEVVQDLMRGLRMWGPRLLKQLQEGDMDRAQLGLGHAYSRAKVKFSVQKNDNHIIQSIALLDTLDKDVNTFAMRTRFALPPPPRQSHMGSH